MNKNHEGYRDPTACAAIRRIIVYKRKRKGLPKNGDTLTYQIGEIPGFKKLME